jgi:hypothetical protein
MAKRQSVEKYSEEQVLKLMLDVYKRYHFLPGVGFMAGVMKTTLHTIHRKMNDLECRGMIVQMLKVKNRTSYKLTEKALVNRK